MQKSLLILFFIFVLTPTKAQYKIDVNSTPRAILSIQPKVGYSISKTSFNIAGNESGSNPNVLSELIWNPTNALEYGIDATLKHQNFILKANISLNNTLFGNVSDIDYAEDNRTAPYSTLQLSNHKGNGYSIQLKPGYNWSKKEQLAFVTYVTFDYSGRKLYLLNDKDWHSSNKNYISGLNSYYKYNFPAYGLGTSLDYTLSTKLSSQLALEGYVSSYYAYGNWNLIEDFEKPISYEHKGKGMKFSSSLAFAYRISSYTKLGLNYQFNHFTVNHGKDFLYSKSQGLMKSKLNKADETKHGIGLNLCIDLPLTK